MEPIFTIIIPHKNIPNLLERCLKSIPEREDLQIIVVDDCSDPSIVDFDNMPCRDRSGVEYIFNKEPKGAGHARNLALDRARGRWVIFADADDFFHDSFGPLLDKYKDSDADLVVFNADSVDTETFEPMHRADNLQERHRRYKKDPVKGLPGIKQDFLEPWAKICRRDVIEKNGFCFEEIPVFNDLMFSSKMAHFSNKVAVDDTIAYCITVRHGSLSRVHGLDWELAKIGVFGRQEAFLRATGDTAMVPIVHYRRLMVQMCRMNGDFRKGVAVMRGLGFSRCHIYSRVAVAALRELYLFPARKLRKLF